MTDKEDEEVASVLDWQSEKLHELGQSNVALGIAWDRMMQLHNESFLAQDQRTGAIHLEYLATCKAAEEVKNAALKVSLDEFDAEREHASADYNRERLTHEDMWAEFYREYRKRAPQALQHIAETIGTNLTPERRLAIDEALNSIKKRMEAGQIYDPGPPAYFEGERPRHISDSSDSVLYALSAELPPITDNEAQKSIKKVAAKEKE